MFKHFDYDSHELPGIYWDVKSSEQRIHEIVNWLEELNEKYKALGLELKADRAEIAALEKAFEDFKSHGFDDYYKAQVEKWIDEHLTWVMETCIRHVYFGLTSDGHFCAYVPDSWDDVEFDTGMVYGRSDYGRLILRMEVDGKNVIDNNPPEALII